MIRLCALGALFVCVTATVATSVQATPGIDLTADFNSDNRVDHLDLVQWNADYGIGAGADANGDGYADGADFLSWQREVGSTSDPAPDISHNPEPATLVVWGVIAAVAGLGVLNRRRREHTAALSSTLQ